MRFAPLFLLALAACGGTEEAPAPVATNHTEPPRTAATAARSAGLDQPSQPSGLGKDAQAARAVAVAYFDHVARRDYDAAWALRWKGEGDGGESRRAFIDSRSLYAEHHATVGNPGPVEGAAGSLYVEVPVHLYGRLASGKPFGSAGTVTLRRVNDVPGSTSEQRRWRIYSRD